MKSYLSHFAKTFVFTMLFIHQILGGFRKYSFWMIFGSAKSCSNIYKNAICGGQGEFTGQLLGGSARSWKLLARCKNLA